MVIKPHMGKFASESSERENVWDQGYLPKSRGNFGSGLRLGSQRLAGMQILASKITYFVS